MITRREAIAVPGMLTAGILLGQAERKLHRAQGEMAGEVTATTALLQTRLTATPSFVDGDLRGASGWVKFEYALKPDFVVKQETDWHEYSRQDAGNTDNRALHIFHSRNSRLFRLLGIILDFILHSFHHDDSIIDEEADGQNHGK